MRMFLSWMSVVEVLKMELKGEEGEVAVKGEEEDE
jgi:hypothetical protein